MFGIKQHYFGRFTKLFNTHAKQLALLCALAFTGVTCPLASAHGVVTSADKPIYLPKAVIAVAHELPDSKQGPIEQAVIRGLPSKVTYLLTPSAEAATVLLPPAKQHYLLAHANRYAGHVVESNRQLKKSAMLGFAQAQYEWATLLIGGNKQLTPAPKQAGVWLEKAAQQGHRDAQLMTAMGYEQGTYGLRQQPDKAVVYYRKGALNADPIAQYALAYLYEKGRGVESDLPMAFHWYLQAAQHGLTAAEYKVGKFYLADSLAVAKNTVKAKYWLEKAANSGYVDAQLQLGLLYEEGTLTAGSPQKDEQQKIALGWYKKAANAGDMNGQMAVATFYLMGWGTEVNSLEAYKWFKASASQGNEEARNWMTIVEQELSPQELSRARRVSLER
jgi:TPR repeat protein